MTTVNKDVYTTLRKTPKITVSDENKFIRTLDDVFVDLNIKLIDRKDFKSQIISRVKRRVLGRIDKTSVSSLISGFNEVFGEKRKYSLEFIEKQPNDPKDIQLLYQCIEGKFIDNSRRDDTDKWNAIKGYLPIRITLNAPEFKDSFISFANADMAKKYVHNDTPASFNISDSLKGNYKVWDFRSFIAHNIILAQTYVFSVNQSIENHKGTVAKAISTKNNYVFETDGKYLRFGGPSMERMIPISDFSKLPKGFDSTSKGNAVILSESFAGEFVSMFFSGYYGELLKHNGLDLSKYSIIHDQKLKGAGYYEREKIITTISTVDMVKLNQILTTLSHKLASYLEDAGHNVFILKKDMASLSNFILFSSSATGSLSYRKDSIDSSIYQRLTEDNARYSNETNKLFKEENITNATQLIAKYDYLKLKKVIADSYVYVARKGIEASLVSYGITTKSPEEMMIQNYTLTDTERLIHATRLYEFVEYRVSEIQFAWEELRDIGDRARSHEDTKAFLEAKQSYLDKLKSGSNSKLTKIEEIAKKSIETELAEVFSDVELDIDTDINLYNKFENEVIIFVNKSKLLSKNNRFKVRKLGNHKALGLYYPSQKTLVVDVSSPSSFIHEFGHLMDHELGDLSLSESFSNIVKKTIEILEERVNKMPDGNKLKSSLTGDGKYNFEYFIRPREIFARAFEIHCSLNLGLVNSIMETSKYYSSEFAYIAEKQYLSDISSYFSKNLPK